MPIDTNDHWFQLLLRQFDKGNVVLFAGAGFSVDAKNRSGNGPPAGPALARILAEASGWSYEDEPLSIVYAQAQTRLGKDGLNYLLSDLYRNCIPAAWHPLVAQLIWYRIFTTNIDDVIENSYREGGTQLLESITCPAPFSDHDEFFEHVQCVHLHGSVLDLSKGLTFSLTELADQTAKPNPWYQAMVANMLNKSFIFVGTRLAEAPFYHYLGLRSERESGTPEFRAKAFLVSTGITPMYRRQFEDQNFVVIDSTAEEFFNTLVPAVLTRVPTRLDVLKNRFPHQIAAINEGVFNAQAEVLRQFELVSGGEPRTTDATASYFYAGAPPSWDDIREHVDAEREVTDEFLEVLTKTTEGINVFALVGQSGSGKTTTAKRLAFELFQDGRTVYFCTTPQRLQIRPIVDLITSLLSRPIFIFLDDARSHVNSVMALIRSVPTEANVTFVLTDRTHILLPKLQRAKLKAVMLDMPGLVKKDCQRIIERLEAFGLLGALQGLQPHEQLREFLGRSRKQLLVAMKEATSGRGFDVIIEDEYRTLATDRARLAYVIVCLAYSHGVPVRRRHLLACLDGTDLEKASTLENDLNGVVIKWGSSEHLLSPRHRVIADHIITGPAPIAVREEAIKTYLVQISSEIDRLAVKRRTAEFVAYKQIINFDSMQDLFGDDYEVINGIYAHLRSYYGSDYLFWLQYGRAEVHFDNFSTAENYLNQSLGIRHNYQAEHYLGVLFMKRALYREHASEAAADVKQGEVILRQQIHDRGETDAYPYSALLTHKLRYLRKYRTTRFKDELEELKELAEIGFRHHVEMRDVYNEVLREYLMQSITTSADDADEQSKSVESST